MEEDEMIRRAIEESTKLDQQQKSIVDEEEEMIRQAIMLS
jgi:adenylate kinase family enzyme